MKKINGGLTLIELLIAIMLMSALMGAMVYIFQAVLLSWSSQETRAGVNISSSFTITSMVQDLRKAVVISDNSGAHEIRFGVKHPGYDPASRNPVIDYYIYYFYNANNTYPPSFNQTYYQIRKCSLGDSSTSTSLTARTFTYSSGQFIVDNITSPHDATSPSNLSVSNNVITIDLTMLRGQNEKIRDRSSISPRNLNNQ